MLRNRTDRQPLAALLLCVGTWVHRPVTSPLQHLTAVVLVGVIGVASCAHRSPTVDNQQRTDVGTVALELVPPPVTEVTAPTQGQQTLSPEAAPETVSQALPTYPSSALEDRIACTVQLLYHIQTDGSATVARLEWNPGPPQIHVEAFESAIRDAVGNWEFIPAYQMRSKRGADGNVTSFEKHLIPKARDAVIRFRVEDGKAIVE